MRAICSIGVVVAHVLAKDIARVQIPYIAPGLYHLSGFVLIEDKELKESSKKRIMFGGTKYSSYFEM